MAAAYLPHIGLLLGDYRLTADQGSYSLSGQDAIGGSFNGYPGPLPHLALLGGFGGNVGGTEAGSYSVTGRDASFLRGLRLVCNPGFYTLSGQPALFSQSVNQGGNPAPLPHLGLMLSANVTSYTLTADPGVYGIFGSDGLADYEMSAASGTYGISGQDAAFNAVHFITAETGAYAVTGQTADFAIGSPSRTMTAEQGAYAISGQANSMSAGYGFPAEQGFYALLGQTANLSVGTLVNYSMLAEHGDYLTTGVDALFDLGDPVLWAQPGFYVIDGQSVRDIRRDESNPGGWPTHHPKKKPKKRHRDDSPDSPDRSPELPHSSPNRQTIHLKDKDRKIAAEIKALLDEKDALQAKLAAAQQKAEDDDDDRLIDLLIAG